MNKRNNREKKYPRDIILTSFVLVHTGYLMLFQHQLSWNPLRWNSWIFQFLIDRNVHYGNRNIRTLVYICSQRTRAAHIVAAKGIQTHHLLYVRQMLYLQVKLLDCSVFGVGKTSRFLGLRGSYFPLADQRSSQ